MPLFWVWIVSAHREEFRSCDKTTDVRLAPLAVSKWMHPKILVSQLVRTFCGAHPSPIFPLILFSGWFVFAVCLAVILNLPGARTPSLAFRAALKYCC